MSDAKADALAKKLKDSLAQRRPRPWKLVIATLLSSVLLLALLAWWLRPQTASAPLQVMALDTICTPDETPTVRAQLLTVRQIKDPPHLMTPTKEDLRLLPGHTIVFHEPHLLLPPGVEAREVVVKSDERGQASVEWALRKPMSAEFLVLHIDAEQRKGSPQDLGRIFVWPKDAPLLVVDADETLIADELDAQASATLTKAAKDGWHVVYLAPAQTRPHEFRAARGWLTKHQAKLPAGPVLGRQHFAADETTEQVRRDLLKQIQERFHGPMLAVVKNGESAQVCRELGLRTILVGAGPAPAKVVHAPTWADVPITLK